MFSFDLMVRPRVRIINYNLESEHTTAFTRHIKQYAVFSTCYKSFPPGRPDELITDRMTRPQSLFFLFPSTLKTTPFWLNRFFFIISTLVHDLWV